MTTMNVTIKGYTMEEVQTMVDALHYKMASGQISYEQYAARKEILAERVGLDVWDLPSVSKG